MGLSLDGITLGVSEVKKASLLYEAVYSPITDNQGERIDLDLNGVGRLLLRPLEDVLPDTAPRAAPGDFQGYAISAVVGEPSEVTSMVEIAVKHGAVILKPAKKSLFAGFRGYHRTPDGVVWELVSENKKDTKPATGSALPTELVTILGVSDTKNSKAFYEALGMEVDHNYGNKFVDFRLQPGRARLALMQEKALAKDIGAPDGECHRRALVLEHRAGSPEEIDAIIAAVTAAGGDVMDPAGSAGGDPGAREFTDPDGFRWRVSVL